MSREDDVVTVLVRVTELLERTDVLSKNLTMENARESLTELFDMDREVLELLLDIGMGSDTRVKNLMAHMEKIKNAIASLKK